MGTDLSPAGLQRISIFADLSSETLSEITRTLRLTTLPANSNLIMVEQPGDRVYIILTGTVKVFVEHADGSEVILALLGRGEIVGEMSLVDNLTRSASVSTLEECTLAWLDRASFWRQMSSNQQLTQNMVTLLSRRLRLANTRIQANATLDAEGRVALQLLALAQEFGEPDADGGTRIPVRLAQNELAALVGASRVRVNQIMVDYKRRGYVRVDNDLRITLLDPEALRRQCDDELLIPDRVTD